MMPDLEQIGMDEGQLCHLGFAWCLGVTFEQSGRVAKGDAQYERVIVRCGRAGDVVGGRREDTDIHAAIAESVFSVELSDLDMQMVGLGEQGAVLEGRRIVADPEFAWMKVAEHGKHAAHVIAVGMRKARRRPGG